jgi:hypothetical protein
VAVFVVACLVWLATRGDDDTTGGLEERATFGSEFATDDPTPEQVRTALQFAYLEFPPAVEVARLAFREGVDEEYRLLVAVDPGTEEQLLRDSGFTGAFAPAESPERFLVPGVDVPEAGATFVASDTVETDGLPLVYRDVLIDRSDPNRTVLHITAAGN